MPKFKYNNGDKIGPYNILLIERTEKRNNTWYGIFKCPYCNKNFETAITRIIQGKTKSCGCIHHNLKWTKGMCVGPLNMEILDECKDSKKRIFKCPECGNPFEGSINSVQQGTTVRCKKCKEHQPGEVLGPFNTLLVDILKDKAKKDRHRIGLFKCHFCGNLFESPINKVSTGHTSSCGCLKSKGEQFLIQFFIKNKIPYIHQYFFKDCVFPETKSYLFFDFYLPQYNALIEYDGLHHFKYDENSEWRTQENVLETQKRDLFKNEYCTKNNILLIRIPYWEKLTEENIIRIFNDNRINF